MVAVASHLRVLPGEEPQLERRHGTAHGTRSLYAVDDLAVGDSGRFEWWYLALTIDPEPRLVDGFELGSTAR